MGGIISGPNLLWIAQAKLDILTRPLKDELIKDTRFLSKSMLGGYGLVTAPAEDHPRMRKLFSHAFASFPVQNQAELVVARHVDTIISKMGKVCRGGGTLDLAEILNLIIYDAMAEVTFGESLQLLETGENVPWKRIMVGARNFVVFRAVFLGLPVLGPLLEVLTAGPMRRMKEHYRLSEGMVKRRLERKEPGDADVWDFVMEQRGSDKGLSMDEMYANSSMLPLAGESPAVVLSGILYHALKNTSVYAKLNQEIRTTFSDFRGAEISGVSVPAGVRCHASVLPFKL
ncbi:cytochrome P450 [Candidatus Bathyarchaeota archaeon]|nr:cytochrome P450 [Candidatus Bathyarchaeota archaeon]